MGETILIAHLADQLTDLTTIVETGPESIARARSGNRDHILMEGAISAHSRSCETVDHRFFRQ
jgi:hypothetical protein